MNPEIIREHFVHHFSLDSPERIYEQSVQWNITRPRVETWCLSVDAVPEDMRPRWKPRPDERDWAVNYLKQRGLEPTKFAVVNFACDVGMFHKQFTRMPDVIRKLSEVIPVLVLHKFGPASRRSNQDQYSAVDLQVKQQRDWDALVALGSPRIILECNLSLRQLGSVLGLAKFGVGPDSALLHFAAAVDLPYLGLFGPTSGEVTTRHYGPNARFIQGPIDATWQCAPTSPCQGVRERNFWCHQDQTIGGECLQRIEPDAVVAECVKHWGAG